MNRLNLDWSIETNEDRAQFIQEYIQKIPFKPTPTELETMSNYILWGKDPVTGLNGRQQGFELKTRFGTWDSAEPESLEGLMEMPGFLEASVKPISAPATKVPRQVFSRSDARKNAPSYLIEDLEGLWTQIDETEYTVQKYELDNGKRKTPIRDELVNRLSDERIEFLDSRAASLGQYAYLKLKHDLVNLRDQQFIYKDSYTSIHLIQPEPYTEPEPDPTFGDEIPVYPFSIPREDSISQKIFRKDRFPEPEDFNEEELKVISSFLWSKDAAPDTTKSNDPYFDFGNTDHLYELFNLYGEFREDRKYGFGQYSNMDKFLDALESYWALSELEDYLEDIVELKIEKKGNQEIADIINRKYGKSYKPNYISTLYCKKCLAQIAATALKHREVMENVFFPENFKRCKDCGRAYLLGDENFVKRHRSKDGYSPRCKKCEKKLREKRK